MYSISLLLILLPQLETANGWESWSVVSDRGPGPGDWGPVTGETFFVSLPAWNNILTAIDY